LGLVLVWIGFSVLGAMWAVVIAALVSYLVSRKMIVAYIDTKANPNNYHLKSFYKYSIPVLIQAFALTSFFTIDVILVKHFFSPFDAGIYAALSTLGKIVFFASSPITAVMFPIVSGRYTKGEKYKKILLASIGATVLISFGVVFLYFLFPNIAIGALYGKSYLSASSNLVWMGLFIAFYTVSYLLTNFFLSIGKTNIVYVPLIAAILQISGIWIWHNSLLGVIQISLTIMVMVCLTLLGYLRYNSYSQKELKSGKK
jgi:O-antigen/teichoic acid export membrane protein